jgi:hypothetical protein
VARPKPAPTRVPDGPAPPVPSRRDRVRAWIARVRDLPAPPPGPRTGPEPPRRRPEAPHAHIPSRHVLVGRLLRRAWFCVFRPINCTPVFPFCQGLGVPILAWLAVIYYFTCLCCNEENSHKMAFLGLDTPENRTKPSEGTAVRAGPRRPFPASSPGTPRGGRGLRPRDRPCGAGRSDPDLSLGAADRSGARAGTGARVTALHGARPHGPGVPKEGGRSMASSADPRQPSGRWGHGSWGSGRTPVPPRWFWEIDRMLRSVRGVRRAGGPRGDRRARASGQSGHPRIRVAEFLPFAL